MVAAFTHYSIKMDKAFLADKNTWPKSVSTQGLKRCSTVRLYTSSTDFVLVVELQNDTGRGKTGPHSRIMKPLYHLTSLFAVADPGLKKVGIMRSTIRLLGNETVETLDRRFPAAEYKLQHIISKAAKEESEESSSSSSSSSSDEEGGGGSDAPDNNVRPADKVITKRLIDSGTESDANAHARIRLQRRDGAGDHRRTVKGVYLNSMARA